MFAIQPFICFIRLLLLAPFFMSVPVRYCLEEKCRKANSIGYLPLGSPEDIDTPKENEMFISWTIMHTLFTVWLGRRTAHYIAVGLVLNDDFVKCGEKRRQWWEVTHLFKYCNYMV